ncbi:hypothetical protein PTKIN_Ptkin09bG0032000 [Pterospermum kingtungense]
MDFFKSVFSDQQTDPTPNPEQSTTWSFGGLLKTLTDKSESVIESYRKDFEELGTGLKKETEIIRSVASRAVNDSLEVGASVAQEKLESVGQAIDDIGSSVWKSTALIISHGKDTFLLPSYDDNSDYENPSSKTLNVSNNITIEKGYSRFEMQIRVLQSDKRSYCTEPVDLEDFENWKLGFNLEEKKGQIEDLFSENPVIADIFKEVGSDEFEYKRYWCNYFYKVSRLMKAEEVRAKLVKRAISVEEEDDLSWDIDEDDGDEESEKKKNLSKDGEKLSENNEEKLGLCKDSDVSVVSSRASMSEEEGWDKIDEIRRSVDNKREDVGSLNKVDMRKQLVVAEEEEDLSWDIDDDEKEDQLVKA